MNKGFAVRCEEEHRKIWGMREGRKIEERILVERNVHRMSQICNVLGENEATNGKGGERQILAKE